MIKHSVRLLLAIVISSSCNKANKTLPSEGPDSLQSKDKASEEPIGLPGYPLLCQWLSFPTQQSPSEATMDCFLSSSKREAVTLTPTPEWRIIYQGPVTVVGQLIDPIFRLRMTASAGSEVLNALQDMQVRVRASGAEVSITVREALKADEGHWRIGAACGNLFTISIVNAQASFNNTSVNRFEGCETLATRLTNVTVPNLAFRQLPDAHKAIMASCDKQSFTLATSAGQKIFTLVVFNAEACQDLSFLVNSLGL